MARLLPSRYERPHRGCKSYRDYQWRVHQRGHRHARGRGGEAQLVARRRGRGRVLLVLGPQLDIFVTYVRR